MRLNATMIQNVSANTAAALSPIYNGKVKKRLVISAAPVPKKHAAIRQGTTVFKPLRNLYTTDGNRIYALVAQIFASSPTPAELLPIVRSNSLSIQTITPSTGPSKKEMSKINTFPKSSFKNGAAGKMGKSSRLTTYESATNDAISAARRAENALRALFERIPAPAV